MIAPLPGVAPLRLHDLIAGVRAMFAASAITTKVLVGEDQIAQEGNGDTIVLVPRPRVGEVKSAPIRMGQVGSARIAFGCTAYIWGVSGNDSETRYDAAEQILFNLMIALADVSGDRVELAALDRTEEPRDVFYGEDYHLDFTYLYQVNRSTDLRPVPNGTTIAVQPVAAPKDPT